MPARTNSTILTQSGRVIRRRRRKRPPPPRPKRTARSAMPAGPYRSESSVRSIREKAPKGESERLARGRGRTAKRVRRLAEADRRRERQEARSAAQRKAFDARLEERVKRAQRQAREVARRKTNAEKAERAALKSFRKLASAVPPDPETAITRARQTGARLSKGRADAFKLLHGEDAYRRYEKARHAYIRDHEDLGEPEDLTTLITLGVPGGGAAFQVGKAVAKKGATTVAKAVGEAAASKVESTAARTATRTLNAGSGVRAGGRLAGRAATRAAGRKVSKKAAEKATRSAAARAGRRQAARAAAERSRSASAAVPGLKLGKVGAVGGAPVVQGHVQAAVDSPVKTAKTTARAVPGLLVDPIVTAGAASQTAGRAGSAALHDVGVPGFRDYSGAEIIDPVKRVGGEQLAFAKQVAKVVTADDSAEVKRAVEDELGLLLPIMLGLTGAPAAKKLSKGRVRRAVREIAEEARRTVGREHGRRRGQTPRVFEKSGQRKEAAQAAAKGRTRVDVELADRQRAIVENAQRASRKDVVRRGVGRKGKLRRRADLEIHDGDVVSFLQAHPMKLDDPLAAFREVLRIERKLKPIPDEMRHLVTPDQLATRDVIAHIKRRPDVLSNPDVIAAVREYREQGKEARETPGISPEHSERARFTPAAITRDIPLPEEMHPRSIRDVARTAPTRGKLSKDVLRREARRDRSRARALRKKAATAEKRAAIIRRDLETREKLNKTNLGLPPTKEQLRELEAVREMERRGIIAPDQTPVGSHLEVVTPKGSRRKGRVLPAVHDRLRDRIDKLDRQAVELREKADAAEEMAKRKDAASREIDPTLTPEFTENVTARLAAEGITELPEYAYRGPGKSRTAPVYGSSGTRLTEFPGKSKRRKGTAEEYGLVEEGLTPLIRDSIARPLARRESYKVAREVIENNRYEVGEKHEWTAAEADALFTGADPILNSRTWMKVPRQFYKRIYDVLERGGAVTAEDFELLTDLQKLRETSPSSSRYMIVRSAAMHELIHQLSADRVFPALAAINRVTTFAILGTSPAWAATQIVAEFAQAAAAQPRLLNPAHVKKLLDAYNAMPAHKRQAFDSWVGVTRREIQTPEELKLDLRAGDMDAAADAFSVWRNTKAGRIVRAIPRSIVKLDRWKGGKFRTLATLSKIDKDLNARTNAFLRGVRGMDDEMGRALDGMRGRPLHEQAAYIAEHPKLAKRFQGYLDDVMGNWAALTKNEQIASQLVIFYPFLRMSLRWTLYSFPKHHPIKASVLLYLGQQNAVELEKLLGGPPSFFAEWAKVAVPGGGVVNLAGVAPGANSLVEALGGSTEGPKGIVAARVGQPLLAALGTFIYGVSPLSGKQESGSGWRALAQLLSLSAPIRAIDEATVSKGRKRASTGFGEIPVIGSTERQAALDKLIAKLHEYGTAARFTRTLALRALPRDAKAERDSALLSRVLRAFERNSSDARDGVSADYAERMRDAVLEGKRSKLPRLRKERDKRLAAMEAEYDGADKVLDDLFRRYEIEDFKREDDLFLEFYGEGKYGNDSSGYGSNLNGVGSSAGYGSQLSPGALREQFGIGSSDPADLREQFGINLK